jgi:hypothetical protein
LPDIIYVVIPGRRSAANPEPMNTDISDFQRAIASNKSFQSGLSASISAIFQSRRHFLISFSRAMAVSGSSHASYQTSRSTP